MMKKNEILKSSAALKIENYLGVLNINIIGTI